MKTIVGISGEIGSGKTSIAFALSERLPFSSVRSFGAVVRQEASARGRGVTRDELQTTGIELINEGWDVFVAKTLHPQPDTATVIVDGIRHPKAVTALRRLWPEARFLLVYIKPSEATIRRRFEARGESVESLSHAVEAELPDVLAIADLVVVDEDLERSIGEIATAITTTS